MKKLLLLSLTFFAINLQSQTKIESSLVEYYDTSTTVSSWQVSGGTNYQYDANNNVLSETRYDYDTGMWEANTKYIYTYNASNKVTSALYQSWNNSASQFENDYKTVYTYNGAGNLITILDQDWNDGLFINSYKAEITYNGNFIVNVINANWNGTSWVNDRREVATYTGANLTQFLIDEWSGTQWDLSARTTLTYNANNKISNYTSEGWDGSSWSVDENTNYTFSAIGNIISSSDAVDSGFGGTTVYSYDLASQLSSFGHPFKDKTGVDYVFASFPYVNKILSETYSYYDTETSNYILNSRTSYNYQSALPLAREIFEINRVKLYPNPAKSSFEISGLVDDDKIIIYNTLGSKVMETKVKQNEKVNIEHLAGGLYFLNFSNGQSIKFVKE